MLRVSKVQILGDNMKMNDYQLETILRNLSTIKDRSPFYQMKYKDIDLTKIRDQKDFETLPFSDKSDLREVYPLGLQAVPDKEVVRIHSSSGTTGTPVIIPYTKKDVEDWAIQFERCYRMAGITEMDRIHITPGYGLWTAGIGFQAGAERLGAMAIPMGPGNTEKQLKMMVDLQSTVLCATSSYALLLSEEIQKRGIRDKLALKKGVIGSERWGDKMRKRIAGELGVELYDIYGLTEIYGPGIGISCSYKNGIHVWDDYLYFEVINPKTGEVLPDGQVGELVITTLRKEGAPLIRYRTHDLTRIIPGDCPCGSRFPRIDIITGRTDDMIKVKGVNMFPAQFEELIAKFPDASSEYQVMIDHLEGKDHLTLFFETKLEQEKRPQLEKDMAKEFKEMVNITIIPKAVNIGDLPRSEKKTPRIFDNRY
jgi:phenylacetate-CoA ligase